MKLQTYPSHRIFKTTKLKRQKSNTGDTVSSHIESRSLKTYPKLPSTFFLSARCIRKVCAFILIRNLIRQSRLYVSLHLVFVWCLFPAFKLRSIGFHLVSNEQRLWTGIVCRQVIVFINFYQGCQEVLVTSQVHAKVCVTFGDASEQCVAPEIDRLEFCVF